jgi:hypothetical protein
VVVLDGGGRLAYVADSLTDYVIDYDVTSLLSGKLGNGPKSLPKRCPKQWELSRGCDDGPETGPFSRDQISIPKGNCQSTSLS